MTNDEACHQVIPEAAVEAAARAIRDHNQFLPDLVAMADTPPDEFDCCARVALEAAAPHMTRTITTRVELEALWLGSVVLSEGVAYQRFGTDDWAGEGRSFDGGQIVLPATVLHNPSPYRLTK